MDRREFVKRTLAGMGALAFIAPTTLLEIGCPSKSTIAALVATLGASGAALATQFGNSALAETITTDTKAAVDAVTNWHAGTGAKGIALQLLNVLLANLKLIPFVGAYAVLLALAINTVTNIITILSAPSNASMKANYEAAKATGVPETAANYKAQWNGICATDPQLYHLRIK